MSNFPGYEYDDKRHCYFRVPPKHFKQVSYYKTAECVPSDKDLVGPLKMKTGCRLHSFLQHRSINVKSSVHSLRLLNEYLLPKLKEKAKLRLNDISSQFLQYDNIMIDKSGELLAVKYTSENESTCAVYRLQRRQSGYYCEALWKKSTAVTPGLYSMNFTTDDSEIGQKHFLCLCSDNIIISKYCDNKPVWIQTKRLSEAALCMTVCPSSSDWDKMYFAVGFHCGNIHAYNIDHKVSFSTSISKTNILSLASSLKDPLLFAGCRNGTCHVWDTRLARSPITVIKEPSVGTTTHSSIIGLHPLHDHNYIITNALNSRLSLWDLRMRQKVLVFSGHTNEYKTCSSIVDKLESFVAAVGSDGNTKIWSTRTGALLHCLSRTSSNNTLPHITFSEFLGGGNGEPSLLVTEDDNLLIYNL